MSVQVVSYEWDSVMARYRQELESMGIDCCTAYFILKVNKFI